MEQKRKILPPVWLLLGLVLASALHYFMPIVRLVSPPWSYAGAILIVVGILMSAVGARSFRKAGTPVVPFEQSTALVDGGLYRFTRNPMYLGLTICLLGAGVLFGTLGALLPVPLFVWLIQSRFIVGEERFLEEIFGEQYLAYKRRVRRWL
jgi:protein-S-isoprenylcysteine O-methyltransferase Ste14